MKVGSYSLYVYITVFYIDGSLIFVSANADPSTGAPPFNSLAAAQALRAALRKVAVSSCRVRMPPIFRICAAVIAVIFHGFFQDGKPRRWETLIFSRSTFRSFWSLRVELFVGGSICSANRHPMAPDSSIQPSLKHPETQCQERNPWF